jgi:hypothetical protein
MQSRNQAPRSQPLRRLSAVDIATAVAAGNAILKVVLILLAVVAFFVLDFGTRVPAAIGGHGKQVAFAIIMMCAIPAMVLYFPLSWLLSALVKSWLRGRRG